MSISQVNKLFQNKGCNIAVSVLLGIAVMTFLIPNSSCRGNQNQLTEEGAGDSVPIVKAGELVVTTKMVQDGLERTYRGMLSQFPAAMRIRAENELISTIINEGLALKIAKEQGVDLSVESLKAGSLRQAESALREALAAQGRIAPSASQKELEEAYKAVSGRDYQEERKNAAAALDQTLTTEEGRNRVATALAMPLLVETNMPRFTPSEDELKKSFDSYIYRIINFLKTGPNGETPLQRADKALAEIKGGLSFKDAMNKYSDEAPPKGKKKSDLTIDYSHEELMNQVGLKPLQGLKPDQISDVVPTPRGAALFQLVRVRPNLPEKYEQRKVGLANGIAKRRAQQYVDEEIKKLNTPENVKWLHEGYVLLRDYMKIENDPRKPAEKLKDQLAIMDRALALSEKPQVADVANLVGYLASTMIEKRPDNAALRAKALAKYVEIAPEPDAKIDLAIAYIEAKDKDNALVALKNAAEGAAVHTDDTGKTHWDRIVAAKTTALSNKLITEAEAAEIETIRAQWKKDFDEQKKMERAQEIERKKLEEELKKQGQSDSRSTGGAKPSQPTAPGAKPSKP